MQEEMPQPVTFRREVIGPAMRTVGVGDSCCLVGVGSSGKSNIAWHMKRPDVLKYYHGPRAPAIVSVLVDGLKLSNYTAQSLCALILESLLEALPSLDLQVMGASNLEAAMTHFADVSPAERGRQKLGWVLDELVTKGIHLVIFMLDDFDHVIQKMPTTALNLLRALRDRHKGKVAYVVLTRRELAFLRDESECQDFVEIVSPTTFAIGPYSSADAHFMARQLIARWLLASRVPPAARARLVQISGCHPGLLKTIFTLIRNDEAIDGLSPNLMDMLNQNHDIAVECRKIWDSLETEERVGLQMLSHGAPLSVETAALLQAKGLIHRPDRKTHFNFFTPLFSYFVSQNVAFGQTERTQPK